MKKSKLKYLAINAIIICSILSAMYVTLATSDSEPFTYLFGGVLMQNTGFDFATLEVSGTYFFEIAQKEIGEIAQSEFDGQTVDIPGLAIRGDIEVVSARVPSAAEISMGVNVSYTSAE